MRILRYISTGLFALVMAQALSAQPNHVVISQVYGGGGNGGSTWKNDFIELYNPTGAAVSLAGWSVQYGSAGGTSTWIVTNLTGSIPAGGYYLIKEAQGSGGTTDLPTPNVTGTIAMSGTDGKVSLLSTTTTLSGACPTPASLVDRVGYGSANCYEGSAAHVLNNTTSDVRKLDSSNIPIDTDNNASDFTATASIVPHTSAGVSITQLSPSTVAPGSPDTNVTITGGGFGPDSIVNFTGQASITPPAGNITSTSILVTIPASYLTTAGTPSISVTSGESTSSGLTFTIGSGCIESRTIAQIQGSGRLSPYTGTTQTAKGIVTYRKSNGFFMQMATGDGDLNTSDAIFVFTSSAPTVTFGDEACVTGAIAEFSNAGDTITTDADNYQTEFERPTGGSLTVTKLSSGNALPAAIDLIPDANGAFDQFEKYESMRVKVGTVTVVGPGGVSAVGDSAEADGTYKASGAFWGVLQGTPRPIRTPGAESSHPIVVENSTGASYHLLPANEPIFDSNPERIEIYTGNSGVTVVDVSVGDQVSNIAGVLDVYYGDFEIDEDATTTPGYIPTVVQNNNLTYTAVPVAPASQLTIGSFNLEHFYDNAQNGANTPFEVVLSDDTYQGRLKKASLAIRNVLHTPDILGVVEVENLSTLQALAARINSDAGAASPNYKAFLFEGNDPSGIDVGFLVNQNRVPDAAAAQYFATDTYTGTTKTFDRPPVLLTGTARNTNGAPLPVSVMINHLKALPADDPTSASARSKRQAQAQKLAQFIQDLQTANPGILLAVMGDLNAFEFNDGINDVIGELLGNPAPADQVVLPNTNVITNPLTELSVAFLNNPKDRYSYTESGNAQQLDHILFSSAAMSRTASFAIGHLDADFTESLHYNYDRPERLSDHDGEVAYVNLPQAMDVTSSVSIVASGLGFNRATQLYTGTITIKNTSAAALSGPLQVFFNDLPSGLTLANATGYQGGLIPYITSSGTIQPNATISVPVQFRVQGATGISYHIAVYSGTL